MEGLACLSRIFFSQTQQVRAKPLFCRFPRRPHPWLVPTIICACRSQELYCHLLQLASLLLTQAEAGPPVLAGGDQGSQDEDSPADMGDEDGVTFSAAAVGFGGLEEVLYHFSRAPTPASRAGMVALLVQYLGPPGESQTVDKRHASQTPGVTHLVLHPLV